MSCGCGFCLSTKESEQCESYLNKFQLGELKFAEVATRISTNGWEVLCTIKLQKACKQCHGKILLPSFRAIFSMHTSTTNG